MPVLMIGEVPTLTEEIYNGMLEKLQPLLKASRGFIAHSEAPTPGAAGG